MSMAFINRVTSLEEEIPKLLHAQQQLLADYKNVLAQLEEINSRLIETNRTMENLRNTMRTDVSRHGKH
jgi:DNA anti-recombination protein RmuC